MKLDVEHRIWPWWADVGADREDGLREVQWEACKAFWDGIRRGSLVEKARGWHLLGCEGVDGVR